MRVVDVLAKLERSSSRTDREDLFFRGERGNEYLDASALRRRYKQALKRAELRPLGFHDLGPTFGSIAINQATSVQVQAWMGHADVDTTMEYMHHRSRTGDARLLSAAFRPKKPKSLAWRAVRRARPHDDTAATRAGRDRARDRRDSASASTTPSASAVACARGPTSACWPARDGSCAAAGAS